MASEVDPAVLIPPLVGYQFDLDLALRAVEVRKQREREEGPK